MLRLYNTLTKKLEEFKPREDKKVRLYACGPTVYDYAHIGNFRTYVMTDVLVRTLKYFGYDVRYVTNITDVGHLTSDSDTGEDKLEKGALREGKTAWEIAKRYTDAFLSDSRKLNLVEPDVQPRPTQEKYLQAQIAFVRELERKSFTYKTDDGMYFDTSKFPSYGVLTQQNRGELQEGARVEKNPAKRNPTDFALWKFSYPGGRAFDVALDSSGKRRQMEWESPWGVGFPGWHIECSAMSRAELGEQIDVHTGGVDLIPIHHTNEIAQSEAATGRVPFSRFWMHGQFITVDGQKMSKSAGNFYHLSDLEDRGFDPLSLRYLYLTAHYRQFLNFTWKSLSSAQSALQQLRKHVAEMVHASQSNTFSQEESEKAEEGRKKFEAALANDLNIPQVLAVAWEVVKKDWPASDKLNMLYTFDDVLGLRLRDVAPTAAAVPKAVQDLVNQREQLRKTGQFAAADDIRRQIKQMGYRVQDTPDGPAVKSKQTTQKY